LYIESSVPRVLGDKARIISPTFLLKDNEIVCFSFWYNMYGPNIGSLNVYIKQLDSSTQLWSKRNNQGSAWLNGNFTIAGPGELNVSLA